MEGDWVFHINSVKFSPSLNSLQTTCTHGFPDHIDQSEGDKNYHFAKSTQVEATLAKNYKVYQNGIKRGVYTPIYDQGFLLNLGDGVFTAYMMYYKNQNKGFSSDCNKTMIGWFYPKKDERDKNWSCFYGIKISRKVCKKKPLASIKKLTKKKAPKLMEVKTKENNDDDLFKVDGVGLLQLNSKKNQDFINSKYEAQEKIVNEINSMGLTWKAGFHDDFKGMSFKELNNHPAIGLKRRDYGKEDMEMKKQAQAASILLQIQNKEKLKKSHFKLYSKILDKLLKEDKAKSKSKSKTDTNTNTDTDSVTDLDTDSDSSVFNPNEMERKTKSIKESDSHIPRDHADIIKYIEKEVDDIPTSALPKNWDWRNVGGKNYVPKPRLQRSCKSCYIFSTLSSLESRLRIQTNLQDKTTFSRQFIASCGIYTEGCKGGYPILVGKFAHDFELAPDSCMAYKAETWDCSKRCDLSKYPNKYTVSRYEYLGGYYGATSELMMMKEIRARGPMPGNLSVPWTFSYYKSGIYANFNKKAPNSTLNNTTMFDKGITWEKVDHSILLVGWGEEKGVKYWICMNTWGRHWGEKGFFRILRGKNECSIESMGDVMRIKKETR